MHKIVFQTRIDSLRVELGLKSRFIDADQFLAATRVFAKAIVGDAIEPGRKLCLAAKAPNVLVSAQKCFLSKIVGQGKIGARKLSKQTSHARLMPTNQLAESVLVVVDKNSRDEVRIGELHIPTLRWRERRGNFLLALELPNEEVTDADEQRDKADTPGATFPIIDGSEKEYHA